MVTLAQQLFGPDTERQASALGTLGRVRKSQGRREDAARQFTRALDLLERSGQRESRGYAEILNQLGVLAREAGDLEHARARHRAALAVYERVSGKETCAAGLTREFLADVDVAAGHAAEAIQELERARAQCEPGLGPRAPDLVEIDVKLGTAQLAAGRVAAAAPPLERALGARLANHAKPAEIAAVEFELAKALWATPTTRARARSLATEAGSTFASVKASDQATDVARWLSTR
jgi:hypothetical protein